MIVFDIDGTLSIVGDRLKCLADKDWDSFFARCGEDKVNRPIARICDELAMNNRIVYVTGRRESCRADTLAWLHKEAQLPFNTENLYMRPDGDFRHDSIVKLELVKEFIDDIEMVFEDRGSMVKAWRAAGLTCLQVATGDF